MAKISYATLQKKYPGKYVLTDGWDGKVVAVHMKLSEAYKIAEKKGFTNPAVQHIEPANQVIIYGPFSLSK